MYCVTHTLARRYVSAGDAILKVFIDNNLWDYFAKHNIDLEEYFPKADFQLCVTKHCRYEVLQMPERCEAIKNYAKRAIGSFVEEDSYFGYLDSSIPDEYQRMSGYGVGRYISSEEQELRKNLVERFATQSKRKQNQILFKQEADIEIASRSALFPIVTFDTKKKGPIYFAYSNDYKVIYLDVGEANSRTVREFMCSLVKQLYVYKQT